MKKINLLEPFSQYGRIVDIIEKTSEHKGKMEECINISVCKYCLAKALSEYVCKIIEAKG